MVLSIQERSHSNLFIIIILNCHRLCAKSLLNPYAVVVIVLTVDPPEHN